jgi:hypothetical protein
MTTGTKSPNSGLNPPVAQSRSAANGASESAKPVSGWAMVASPKYLAALAAVAIIANAAAFYWLRMRSPTTPPAKRSQEMVLGTFEFNRINPRDKQVRHGQFVVTLGLAANLDAAKFREVHCQEKELQAAVEETMRRLRASDFADPRFVRLKNRFQEQLNEELGFDGIDEVIVTNVPEPTAPEQAAEPQAPSEEAAASAAAPAEESAPANTNPNR